jgi:hypothetical protein
MMPFLILPLGPGRPFADARLFRLGMARRRHAVAAEMADEIIVAAAQLGTLRRCHVLKMEVRQIGLTQHGLVRRIRATAGVFLPSSHGASMRKNT